jgi:hypothetical protein
MKSSSFIDDTLSQCQRVILDRLEIEKVVTDMVGVVEIFWIGHDLKELQIKLAVSNARSETLIEETQNLLKEKAVYDLELDRIRSEAASVRESLVHDVGFILSESKKNDQYQKRIKELEERVLELVHCDRNNDRNIMDNESNNTTTPLQQRLSNNGEFQYEFSNAFTENTLECAANPSPILSVSIQKFSNLIFSLEDSTFLLAISYLEMVEVSNVAFLNRRLFIRIGKLLQYESKINKDDWLLNQSDSLISIDPQQLNVTHEIGGGFSLEKASENTSPSVNGIDLPSSIPISGTPSKNIHGEGRLFGKFSMLLAAADTMLPPGLTAGMMNGVWNPLAFAPSSSSKNDAKSGAGASPMGMHIIHVQMEICMCICIVIFTSIYMCTYIYIYIYTYKCMHIYTYI